MLEISKLSFGYNPETWIFDNVDLTLQPGEVVGLYGKSGIGKSTFAKVIAGYLKADKGNIRVDGIEYTHKGRNPVQIIGQHPEKAINPRWRMNQVLEESGTFDDGHLQKFGISKELLHRFPSQLSGGELQRFCLARTVVPETKYLIADEMTTMLDAINQAQIWETVLQLVKDEQIGMLVVSHELALLDRISDRILKFEELISTN